MLRDNGEKVREVTLLWDSFQRCLSFQFNFYFLLKPPVVYKHFICLEFKDIEIYNSNVWEKKKNLPSKMDIKILQNEDLCYFKNSGIDQCCHIWIFNLYVVGLSVFVICMFLFSVSNSLLTILHTHKRCGFCLRKARVPDTNSIIFMFLCLCGKKATENSSERWRMDRIQYHCLFETKRL